MSVATVKIYGVDVEVEFNYSYDPGVWTLRNGDPGYPASEELDIVSIHVGNVDVSNWLEIDMLYNEIDNKVTEVINKYEDI